MCMCICVWACGQFLAETSDIRLSWSHSYRWWKPILLWVLGTELGSSAIEHMVFTLSRVSSPQWPLLKHWQLVNCQSDLCFPTHHVLNLASLPVVHGAELPDPTSVLKCCRSNNILFFIRHFILFCLLQIKSMFFRMSFHGNQFSR